MKKLLFLLITSILILSSCGNDGKVKTIYTGDYKDGVAIAMDSEGYYFHVDNEGNKLYENRFDIVNNFNDDRAKVCSRHVQISGMLMNLKDDCFFINKNGEPICDEKIVALSDFQNGRAIVRDKNYKNFYVDLDCNPINESTDKQNLKVDSDEISFETEDFDFYIDKMKSRHKGGYNFVGKEIRDGHVLLSGFALAEGRADFAGYFILDLDGNLLRQFR